MQDWVFRLRHSLIFKRSHRVWNKNNIILPTYLLLSFNKVNIVLHFTFYMFSTLLIGALGPHHAYLFTQMIQIPEYLKRGCYMTSGPSEDLKIRVGIIYPPPGWDRVNCSAKHCDGPEVWTYVYVYRYFQYLDFESYGWAQWSQCIFEASQI